MTATLAQFAPIDRRPVAVTSGPVTALRVQNSSPYLIRLILGGILYDMVPGGQDQTYILSNASGYAGWALLIPATPGLQNAPAAPTLNSFVTVTSYGGGDVIPYGTATQLAEGVSRPFYAQPDPMLDSLRGGLVFAGRMFGLAMDGVTIERAQCQALLDACRICGGGIVDLPAGTLLCDTIAQPINPAFTAGLVIGSNTRLRGAGVDLTTIKLVTTAPDGVKLLCNYNQGTLSGTYNTGGSTYTQPANHDNSITVSDLTLDGQCDAQVNSLNNHYGIDMQSASRVLVERVRARNVFGNATAAAWLTGSYNYPLGEGYHFSFYSSYLVSVNDCEAESTSSSKTSNGFRDAGCTIVRYARCVAHGMAVGPGFHSLSDSSGVHTDCYSYSNAGVSGVYGGVGFALDSSRDHLLKNCVAGTRSPVVDSWPFANSTNLGNGQSGIVSAGATHLYLDHCVSRFNGQHGLAAFGGPCDTIVDGGSYSDNTSVGIYATGANNCVNIKSRPVVANNTAHQINSVNLAGGCDLSGGGFNSQRPAVPASTTAIKNPFPCAVLVLISGGTVSNIQVTEYEYNVAHSAVSLATATPTQVVLQPFDQITLTYTVAPTWTWQALL